MENNNHVPTDAERYPLIVSPVYREALKTVIAQIRKANIDNVKSCGLAQLYRDGNLTADFCLRHFAGIFDMTCPLPSAQREVIHAILTEAARVMVVATAHTEGATNG